MSATTHTHRMAWSDEDTCYVVKVPDLPGCMAHGKTRRETVKMVVWLHRRSPQNVCG